MEHKHIHTRSLFEQWMQVVFSMQADTQVETHREAHGFITRICLFSFSYFFEAVGFIYQGRRMYSLFFFQVGSKSLPREAVGFTSYT